MILKKLFLIFPIPFKTKLAYKPEVGKKAAICYYSLEYGAKENKVYSVST